METEWTCPICQDARNDIAYTMPCRHQFCLGCILRWIRVKPECPLCRRPIETLRFSVRGEDDSLEFVFTSPEESEDASSQAGRAPGGLAENSSHPAVASPPSSPQRILSQAEQEAAGTGAGATRGGLLPEVWAELFQSHRHLLDPVLPWLRQELEAISGARWWEINSSESCILHGLCLFGLDEQLMVQVLQEYLEEHAAPLVHGIINAIVCRCSEEARRLLHSHGAGEEADSPVASSSSTIPSSSSPSPTSSSWGTPASHRASSSSPSPTSSSWGTPASHRASSSSPEGSDVEEELSVVEATLRGGPGHPPSVPIPAGQQQPQEEPEEAAVAGPSAPGWVRDRSPGASQRCLKRRPTSPQDPAQPCKRLPRRRH